jgi:hypothetical protein
MVRVGSTEGVLDAPEFLWSIKKSPLIILFLKEMGLTVLTDVATRFVVWRAFET